MSAFTLLVSSTPNYSGSMCLKTCAHTYRLYIFKERLLLFCCPSFLTRGAYSTDLSCVVKKYFYTPRPAADPLCLADIRSCELYSPLLAGQDFITTLLNKCCNLLKYCINLFSINYGFCVFSDFGIALICLLIMIF